MTFRRTGLAGLLLFTSITANASTASPPHEPLVGSQTYDEFVRELPSEKSLYWYPSLGLTSFRYRETSRIDYSGLLLQTKVTARYSFKGNWDLGATLALSLLPFNQRPSSHSVRVVTFAARAGYSPRLGRSPFRLGLLFGPYYTKMLVDDDAFGYGSVVGPQFTSILHRALPGGAAGMIFFKFAPLVSNSGDFGFHNRAMGTGIGYNAPLEDLKNVYSINLELEFISIPDVVRVQASSSATLAFGLTF